MLTSVLISPFGYTCTAPVSSRSTMVRRLTCSTSPPWPLIGGDVADADLIFEDEEEAGDDVADQRLRAEADGQADDAGAGEHRGDVHVQLAQDHQGRDADGDHRQRILHELAEGAAPAWLRSMTLLPRPRLISRSKRPAAAVPMRMTK